MELMWEVILQKTVQKFWIVSGMNKQDFKKNFQVHTMQREYMEFVSATKKKKRNFGEKIRNILFYFLSGYSVKEIRTHFSNGTIDRNLSMSCLWLER